jgi:hypothetical protein
MALSRDSYPNRYTSVQKSNNATRVGRTEKGEWTLCAQEGQLHPYDVIMSSCQGRMTLFSTHASKQSSLARLPMET